jgi:hypothetical protein
MITLRFYYLVPCVALGYVARSRKAPIEIENRQVLNKLSGEKVHIVLLRIDSRSLPRWLQPKTSHLDGKHALWESAWWEARPHLIIFICKQLSTPFCTLLYRLAERLPIISMWHFRKSFWFCFWLVFHCKNEGFMSVAEVNQEMRQIYQK